MVSLQTQPSGLSGHGKLTKSRSRIVVKPILKRLHHVHSHHSERNSLDLNRGWDDQPVATTPDVEYGSFDFGSRDLDDLSTDRRNTYGSYAAAPAAGAKLSRDISFSLAAGELGPSSPGLGRANTFSGSHARSTSGGNPSKPSSNRVGSFVHPFQQMPRTSTPPLHSYANSVSSLDNGLTGQQRDLAGAIAESDADEDRHELDADEPLASPTSLSLAQTEPFSPTATKKLSYSSSLRSNSPNSKPAGRPSLSGSQRTSSEGPSSMKISTTRSNSGPSVQRLTQGAVNQSANDSSSSSSAAAAAAAVPLLISTTQQKSASNPITSTSPISPFRTSLDMNGFRLRSRSEMDTVSRQEQVREARRKFEAKEREKEEKYAREQIRKRERADAKEAQKTERAQASKRKTSFGHTSTLSSARNSSSVREKNESEPLNGGEPAADEHFQAPSRSRTAKRRTNSLWTAFILWLRTRLLKLARRS